MISPESIDMLVDGGIMLDSSDTDSAAFRELQAVCELEADVMVPFLEQYGRLFKVAREAEEEGRKGIDSGLRLILESLFQDSYSVEERQFFSTPKQGGAFNGALYGAWHLMLETDQRYAMGIDSELFGTLVRRLNLRTKVKISEINKKYVTNYLLWGSDKEVKEEALLERAILTDVTQNNSSLLEGADIDIKKMLDSANWSAMDRFFYYKNVVGRVLLTDLSSDCKVSSKKIAYQIERARCRIRGAFYRTYEKEFSTDKSYATLKKEVFQMLDDYHERGSKSGRSFPKNFFYRDFNRKVRLIWKWLKPKVGDAPTLDFDTLSSKTFGFRTVLKYFSGSFRDFLSFVGEDNSKVKVGVDYWDNKGKDGFVEEALSKLKDAGYLYLNTLIARELGLRGGFQKYATDVDDCNLLLEEQLRNKGWNPKAIQSRRLLTEVTWNRRYAFTDKEIQVLDWLGLIADDRAKGKHAWLNEREIGRISNLHTVLRPGFEVTDESILDNLASRGGTYELNKLRILLEYAFPSRVDPLYGHLDYTEFPTVDGFDGLREETLQRLADGSFKMAYLLEGQTRAKVHVALTKMFEGVEFDDYPTFRIHDIKAFSSAVSCLFAHSCYKLFNYGFTNAFIGNPKFDKIPREDTLHYFYQRLGDSDWVCSADLREVGLFSRARNLFGGIGKFNKAYAQYSAQQREAA